MEAELQRVARLLVRVICFAACAVAVDLVLTTLTAGSETAQAESAPGDEAPALDVGAPRSVAALPMRGAETVTPGQPPLWAEPGDLAATAARRASAEPGAVARDSTRDRPSSGSTTGPNAIDGLAALTATPAGSLGVGGSGAPDSGPSITQLAVLSAALVGVRWLSQRLRAIELSWRTALLNLHIERPG